MIRSCSVFVFAVFQVISGQEALEGPLKTSFLQSIPRHCWSPPPGISTYQCCPIPMLYPDEDMEACGIEKQDDSTKPPRPPPNPENYECKGLCLMQKSNLLNDNETINYERLGIFIDNWAQANPDFSEAILIAKSKCIRERPPGPQSKVCDQDRVYFCMNANILWNCKLRLDIHHCVVLKDHMDDCRPYYTNPRPVRRIAATNI